jgi:hypothetical protein
MMALAQAVASGAQHPHHHNTCAAGTEHLVFLLLDCRALRAGACPAALAKAAPAKHDTHSELSKVAVTFGADAVTVRRNERVEHQYSHRQVHLN